MGDLIELRKGSLPWDPPGSERLRILNQYGIPTAGLIEQFGQTYFFFCLEGEADSANVWAYIPIEAGGAAPSGRKSQEVIFRELISDGRSFEVALSVDGNGLVRWGRVDGASGIEDARASAFLVLDLTSEGLDHSTPA